MKRSENKRDQDLAATLNIHFLKNSAGFTPISTTTAAIAKYAPNKSNAAKFIDYLLSPTTQQIYAQSLAEYPVLSEQLRSQIPFSPDLSSVKNGLNLLDEAAKVLPH